MTKHTKTYIYKDGTLMKMTRALGEVKATVVQIRQLNSETRPNPCKDVKRADGLSSAIENI